MCAPRARRRELRIEDGPERRCGGCSVARDGRLQLGLVLDALRLVVRGAPDLRAGLGFDDAPVIVHRPLGRGRCPVST